MISWLLIFNSVIALTLFMIGLFVLVRNNKLLLNRLFFSFTTSIAAWITFNYLSNSSIHGDALLWLNKLTLFAPGCAIVFLMMFAGVFAKNKLYSRRDTAVVTFFLLIYTLALSPLVVEDVARQGQVVALHFGMLGPVYFLALLLNVLLVFFMLVYGIKNNKGVDKTRIKIITWSTAGAIFTNLVTNAAIPYFQGSFILTNLGPLSMSLVVAGLFYGITRHRLFDVRLVVARSVGYLLSVFALGMLYGGFAFTVIGDFFNNGVNISNAERAVFAAAAVLLAITFQPLKAFFDRVTTKLFYQDAYETEAYINRLNHILVSTIEIKILLDQVTKHIEKTLKVEYCEFLINGPKNAVQFFTSVKHPDPHTITMVRRVAENNKDSKVLVVDYLEDDERATQLKLLANNIAIIGRIGSEEHEQIGYLLLGSKKSGNSYTKQDIAVIEATVNELFIAIQNALRFEEIERFNETLQQKVEDATRKLRRSNEKLRQLDETKDDFISMASHQLRTPLTSVKGYVSMVLDGDAGSLTPLQKKLLNQSFISAQRMVYLISDLLNVSRLRTGKFVIEPTPCNLSTIIQEEVKQLVETAKGRGLELVYHKPEHFPLLLLDETKMRQVIMNFIDNAIYYTQSGGTITVNLVETAKSVEFTVVDNGIGVPKAEQHHLFSKFFRAHNAKRARPDGTGLGLFMAKKVIVAQGGAIIFKSQEGKGSTFGFSFAKERILTTEDHVVPGIVTGR